MRESHRIEVTYQGNPATLAVMRNDGHCWGRLRQGEAQWDVTPKGDLYDYPDGDALDLLVRALRNPKNVEPALSWL